MKLALKTGGIGSTHVFNPATGRTVCGIKVNKSWRHLDSGRSGPTCCLCQQLIAQGAQPEATNGD